MTRKLRQLEKDFKSFRQECMFCAIIFNTHQTLFGDDDETERLLRQAAVWFFHDYSVLSQEYFFLLISRLTDPSGSPRRENLTVDFLVDQIRECQKHTIEIEELQRKLLKYRKRVIGSRNKLIAHRDVGRVRSGKVEQNWPLQEVSDFLQNLNLFCDLVAKEIGLQPLDFLATPSSGDATDLIGVSRKGVRYG